MSKNTLPLKERMKIARAPMPEMDATERSRSFAEVNQGLLVADALTEATRCIECAKPGCVVHCPVGVKIKEVVALIQGGEYLAAASKMREDNALPAITGRVCPQENQCEGGCILGRKGAPVAIGNLERFIADFERTSGQLGLPPNAPKTGKSVAIVGSGPAGLSAAGDLIQKGHRVRVFEALHELGGVLVYGIPEFRLPKTIVKGEVENLRRMGVEFETNVVVGKSVTIDELMTDEGYDAVFVATGAGLPRFLGVPGEHLNGVYSANEFLTRVNLMRAYQFPEYDEPIYDCRDKDVIVVGGGNTAMDAVRTARRLGARTATLVYRRSATEMPARAEEVKHAREEGIEFKMLTNPVEADRGALCTDGVGRAGRERTPFAGGSEGIGVCFAGQCGDYRRGHNGQSAGAEHHARPENQRAQLHCDRRGDAAHQQARSLCRRRHCDRRSDGDFGHGRGTQGGGFDRCVSQQRAVDCRQLTVVCKSISAGAPESESGAPGFRGLSHLTDN
jgi:glutamate synthase (NADPH/NADH) small chain